MATPVYNQVALPQLSGSGQAAADAQVSNSLTNLGTSLTGLGTRLETRKQAKIDRDNAKSKEIFETALLNAKDENEFNEIVAEFSNAATTDGYVLPGQAAAIQASRTARLKDEEIRQQARGLAAGADEGAAIARIKIGEANAADKKTYIEKKYASDFAELNRLDINRDPAAEEYRSALLARVAKDEGVDISPYLKNSEEIITLGSTTDTGADTDLTTRSTNATIRALQPSVLNAGIATNRFVEISNNSQAAGVVRKDKEIADNDILNNIFAGLQRGETNSAGLLNAIDTHPDLTDLQKNRISKLVPNVDFELTSPRPEFPDPIKSQIYSQTPLQAAATRVSNFFTGESKPVFEDIKGFDPDITVTSITSALNRSTRANPSLNIYKKAKQLEAEGTYSKGFIGSIGVKLRNDLKGTYDISQGEAKIIDNLQTIHNLSNEEMVALVEKAVREDDWPTGINNKPEIRNKLLKDKVEAYVNDMDSIPAEEQSKLSALSTTNAYATEFKMAREQAERYAQQGDTERSRQWAARAAALKSLIGGFDHIAENAESAATENPEAVAREIAKVTRTGAVDAQTGLPFNRRGPQKP